MRTSKKWYLIRIYYPEAIKGLTDDGKDYIEFRAMFSSPKGAENYARQTADIYGALVKPLRAEITYKTQKEPKKRVVEFAREEV